MKIGDARRDRVYCASALLAVLEEPTMAAVAARSTRGSR
jgi:hypothetical protein